MLKHPIFNLTVDSESRIYWNGKLKAIRIFPSGYPYVRIHVSGGKTKGISAHRLVWEAHHGLIPNDKEINHKDGNKSNYRIENLECVTLSQNILHAYRNNLAKQKLSHSAREEIYFAYRMGNITQTQLAQRHGISQKAVSKIVNSKSFI